MLQKVRLVVDSGPLEGSYDFETDFKMERILDMERSGETDVARKSAWNLLHLTGGQPGKAMGALSPLVQEKMRADHQLPGPGVHHSYVISRREEIDGVLTVFAKYMPVNPPNEELKSCSVEELLRELADRRDFSFVGVVVECAPDGKLGGKLGIFRSLPRLAKWDDVRWILNQAQLTIDGFKE